jgi:general secretion pathway protein E
LLADVLRAVVSQRLLRRLCPHCAIPDTDPTREQQAETLPHSLRASPPAWRTASGCPTCSGTGYQGRVGAFETTRIGAQLQRAIREGASEAALQALADSQGSISIAANGLLKARNGETSYLEIVRVLGAHAS